MKPAALLIVIGLMSAAAVSAHAAQGAGTLPVYPGAHAIPKSASTPPHLQDATTLLASNDPLQKVDAWFKAHASQRCARLLAFNPPHFDEAHADIRYACPDGSITLHADGGGTQIGYRP